jgi:hypothetical protein
MGVTECDIARDQRSEIRQARDRESEISDPTQGCHDKDALRDAKTRMRRRESRQNDSFSQKGHQSRPRFWRGRRGGAVARSDRRSARSSEVAQIIRNLHGGVYKPHRVIHRLWTRCGYYATDILRIYLLFLPINVTHYITRCVYTVGSELDKPRNKEIRNG